MTISKISENAGYSSIIDNHIKLDLHDLVVKPSTMTHQMQHLILTLGRQSCRSSSIVTPTSSNIAAPRFPSLSTHCLRLQPRRNYASKPKPSRKPHQPSPQSRHPPPIAPIQPRATSSPSTKPTTITTTTLPTSSHSLTAPASGTPTPAPTLLYLAPTSSAHALSSLTIATFCTTYGLYNFYDAFLVPHPGLWVAVPYMMGGVSVFMIGVGVWIGLGARKLVGSLSVLTRPGLRGGGGGGGVSAAGPAETVIRLEPKRIVPLGFMPSPRSMDVPLSAVQLSTRLRPLVLASHSSPSSSLSRLPGRHSAGRREAVERRAADREKATLGSVLARPFADGLRGLSRWIGRLVGREGLATVWVEGKPWRVDVTGGWFAEEGGALDRVLRVR